MATTFDELQQEQAAWVAKSFPAPHLPITSVLGIVEEYGELTEASNTEKRLDAIADIVIFMADVCTGYGIKLNDLFARANVETWAPLGDEGRLTTLGKLSHHALKHHQQIRGAAEFHVWQIELQLVEIIRDVSWFAASRNVNLLSLVFDTWATVSTRVWRPEVQSCRAAW